ncbi:MAG: ABC transporter substrate-binding protein [Rhodospirillaceae bacterium]|nr:ABC transporter substrate-binding protein [Rhodospirillaceae bacterium]
MALTRRFFAALAGSAALIGAKSRAQDAKILRVALGGFPLERSNPYANIQTPSIIFHTAVFEGLTHLNLDGSVSPRLATAWEQRDPLTWRFKLRDDVVFSNGKAFDAGAVAHAVNYLTGPGPANEDARRDLNFLAGATVVDKHTVDIRTQTPRFTLPRYCSVLLIVEPEAWATLGPVKFAEQPVATGPMVVDEWQPARALFRRNPTAWRSPQIDGVEYINLPDVPARIAALQSGRIDVAYGVAPEDIDAVTAVGGTIATVRDGAAMCIVLNFQGGRATPLADVRVRRALNLAVDRQAIVDVLMGGLTVASGQPSVRQAFGFDPALGPYPHDPAAAKALLAEAGYANGFTMTLETSGGSTNGVAVVQRVAEDLKRVGVNMVVRQKQTIKFLNDFVNGVYEADSFTLQWGGYPTLDALQFTNLSSCRKAKPWFCDPAIQPVIEQAWAETDPAQALALRHQVMRHYRDQAPGIFLHENIAFVGLSPRTTGYQPIFGHVDYDLVRIG